VRVAHILEPDREVYCLEIRDVDEATDELLNWLDSESREFEIKVITRSNIQVSSAADGGIHVDAWASKYRLVFVLIFTRATLC